MSARHPNLAIGDPGDAGGTMKPSPWVRELAVDIEVAIREFLERHPRTSPSEIRHAMRIAARRTGVPVLGRWIVGRVKRAVDLETE